MKMNKINNCVNNNSPVHTFAFCIFKNIYVYNPKEESNQVVRSRDLQDIILWDDWIERFDDERKISACIIILTCTLASVRLIFMARSSLVKTSG